MKTETDTTNGANSATTETVVPRRSWGPQLSEADRERLLAEQEAEKRQARIRRIEAGLLPEWRTTPCMLLIQSGSTYRLEEKGLVRTPNGRKVTVRDEHITYRVPIDPATGGQATDPDACLVTWQQALAYMAEHPEVNDAVARVPDDVYVLVHGGGYLVPPGKDPYTDIRWANDPLAGRAIRSYATTAPGKEGRGERTASTCEDLWHYVRIPGGESLVGRAAKSKGTARSLTVRKNKWVTVSEHAGMTPKRINTLVLRQVEDLLRQYEAGKYHVDADKMQEDEEKGLADRYTCGVEAFLGDIDPDPGYVIDGVLPRRITAMVSAEPFKGKSALAALWAVGVASGRTLAPAFPVIEARNVLWLLGEELIETWIRRAYHIADRYGIPRDEIGALLRERRIVLMSTNPERGGISRPLFADKGGELVGTEPYDAVCALVERHDPGLIVIDPFSSWYRANEQDPGLIYTAVELFERWTANGATVVALHHDTKDGDGYRGSGAIAGAYRWVGHMQDVPKSQRRAQGLRTGAVSFKILASNLGPGGDEVVLEFSERGVLVQPEPGETLDAEDNGIGSVLAERERKIVESVVAYFDGGGEPVTRASVLTRQKNTVALRQHVLETVDGVTAGEIATALVAAAAKELITSWRDGKAEMYGPLD